MRSAVPGALFLASVLTGCANTSAFYLTPYRFEELTCKELKAKEAEVAERLRKSEDLRSRANVSAAGPLVNAVVYEPNHSKAIFEQQLYASEIQRKNCNAPPPPPPPDPAAAPAASEVPTSAAAGPPPPAAVRPVEPARSGAPLVIGR